MVRHQRGQDSVSKERFGEDNLYPFYNHCQDNSRGAAVSLVISFLETWSSGPGHRLLAMPEIDGDPAFSHQPSAFSHF
jgi:hypothetical protein